MQIHVGLDVILADVAEINLTESQVSVHVQHACKAKFADIGPKPNPTVAHHTMPATPCLQRHACSACNDVGVRTLGGGQVMHKPCTNP